MLLNEDIGDYINSIVIEYPDMKSIWLFGSRANESFHEDSDWDLLVFGSREILTALSDDTRFHKPNIDLLVVYDGNEFENPWGEKKKSGSLSGWEWKELSYFQAQYRATKPIFNESGEEEFNVQVTMCRASRVFPLEKHA